MFLEIQRNKINVVEILLSEMKQLIAFNDYNTIEEIKKFLESLYIN